MRPALLRRHDDHHRRRSSLPISSFASPCLFSILSIILALLTRHVAAIGPQVVHHITEPDHRSLRVVILNSTEDESRLGDGQIFITPYISDYNSVSFGPQIFYSNGTLIWNGNYTAKVRAMDAHVCDWLGEAGTHLCYNDAMAVEQKGHSAGLVRFFDNTYTQVGPNYGAEGRLRAPDIHELNVPAVARGEFFLQTIYEMRNLDLTPYSGVEDGWVLDGCFQEVDMRTRAVRFQWCALDWMPLWDTYMYIHGVHSPNFTMPVAGHGGRYAPWDFFHINSIDKNDEGDYVISARHLDAIFKIAGNDNRHGVDPGTILWHLGGKRNDFEKDYVFSRQHTVRFLSTTATETTLSFLDNAFDGWMTSSKNSSAKLVVVNNASMTSTLLHEYIIPGGGLSYSQGSTQVLPNGNVFVGWGNRHYFTEYTLDGELLYHAAFPGNVESFRVWKMPWRGYPRHPPKVVAYAAACAGAPLHAYVSWNGATEVRAWRFYTSRHTHRGPWRHAGPFVKSDFETAANLSASSVAAVDPRQGLYAPYVYAEALDGEGRVLGASKVAHTFVPRNASVAAAWNCTAEACESDWFRYGEELSCGAACARDHAAGAWALAALVCAVEALAWLGGELGWRRERRRRSWSRRRQQGTGVFFRLDELDDEGFAEVGDDGVLDRQHLNGTGSKPMSTSSMTTANGHTYAGDGVSAGLGNLLMLVGLRRATTPDPLDEDGGRGAVGRRVLDD